VAVTGAIENGTPDHLADWALYLMAHVRLAPPLPDNPEPVGKTNVSYKAGVLSAMPRSGHHSIEDLFNGELRRQGSRIVADDGIRVAHHQCSSLWQLAELQYHNGRLVAGFRGTRMAPADYLRALLPAPLAAFRLARTLSVALGRDVPRRPLLASLPMVGLMHLFHAIGESVGYLRGPGDSPAELY